YRCFPHIVNLACQSVLTGMTRVELAKDGSADYERPIEDELAASLEEALRGDPIAVVRSLVKAVRPLCPALLIIDFPCDFRFGDLQLLRDVDTRWSSTLLMIDRAILLSGAINKFSESPEFARSWKYYLTDAEWEALSMYRGILEVPHAFQQRLSHEKTPTLANALPAFEAMISVWSEQMHETPVLAGIITKGITKLMGYRERVDAVPAYTLAIGALFNLLS
ncbi:hypothetical protein FA95DRAFT_1500126, partial [Auriscalpium vulgare]